jgi:SAM-dependent methyltransferase
VLDPERQDSIAKLRAAFETRGYLGPDAARALGVPLGPDLRRIDLPLYLRRLDRDSPLHTLVRLFALHVPVAEPDARDALAPLALDEAEALGVVERRGELAFPSVGFVTTEGLLLARDVPRPTEDSLPADHVLGLNGPALLLARLSVRRPVGSALDVGCGGGVQALLAARHAERVVGVDLNPRAVAFARFNARLNGVGNVEFREGSLFEPVAGERFDLVVCNPPYVISPEASVLFRDAGRPSDSFCAEVVQGAARHLAPGGFATTIVNWVVPEAEPWSRPLERWTEGLGCDAWLLRLDTSDPLTYAASWNRQPDGARYAAALGRWLAYYEAQEIRAIGMGAVVMRRRAAGEPWVSAVDLPARPETDASAAILQAFETHDLMQGLQGREAWLGCRFRVAPTLRLTQAASLSEGRFTVGATQLRHEGALPFEGQADPGALRLLQLADGRRTLYEIAAAMTSGAGPPGEDLLASLVEAAQRLASMGFLVPATEAGEGRNDAITDEPERATDAAATRAVDGRGRSRSRRRPPSVGA